MIFRSKLVLGKDTIQGAEKTVHSNRCSFQAHTEVDPFPPLLEFKFMFTDAVCILSGLTACDGLYHC